MSVPPFQVPVLINIDPSRDMIEQIKELSAWAAPIVIQMRRDLHRRPELGFDLPETASYVADRLAELGIPFKSGVAKTGIVATITGARPGPTVALRADMDALPIYEKSGAPYASEIPGRMHACGHDAHTASLLGTATVLSKMREEIAGTVRLLFQPSEEKLPGGAPSMIDEGCLASMADTAAVSAIFGQHVSPDLPTGTIGVRPGVYMASADEIYVTVKGQGGHAAAPHLLSADPVLCAAHMVTALQSVVSRNAPPGTPCVISIGRVIADGATNVIPESVRLEGTIRAMDEEWRFAAHKLIERVCKETAEAFGARADVTVRAGYPHLRNHADETAFVRSQALAYVGEDRVVDLDIWFAGEDFAYYLQKVPGTFYRIGTGNAEKHTTFGLHHPRFNLDEDALETGLGFMAYTAIQRGRSA